MSSFDPRPRNTEADPDWNREPGIVPVPGSNFSKEMAKYEQFPSKWTTGINPGNPYVYREFPRMLYRAERYTGPGATNGKIACMAAPPDPLTFPNPAEFMRAEAMALQFTERCQLIVNDEREQQRAFENGWRKTPDEAVERLKERDHETWKETAHRAHDDRNMGEGAKREIAAAEAASGGEHVPEVLRTPVRSRARKP